MVGWLARAWLIAHVSMRRQVRKARTHPWIAFFQVFAVVFGVVVAVGRLPVEGYASVWPTPGGYVLGRRLATDGAAVVESLEGFAGVVFVLLVFLTVLKEATEGAMDSHVDTLLVAAGPRAVAVGGVLWSLILTGWQFGALVLAGSIAFGVGAGSPALTVTLTLAGAAILATAVPLGFALALGIRLLFRRVGLLREHRTLVGAPLALVYFGLFVQVRASMALLSEFPVGWYADAGLALAGGDPVRAAVAAVLTPVAAVGFTAASVPLGVRVWYGDDPETRDTSESLKKESILDRALERVASRPTAAVTRTVWRRLLREPRTLLFAALPVAITASVGIEIATRQPAALPVVVGVYGGSTVGMGATLNPLGSAGAGLAAALTVPRGGDHLVRGYVLSAALPGAPVVAALSLAGALATPVSAFTAVAVTVLGGVLAVTAAVVSMAVGVALPNMEGLRPTGSGIRPPRLWATTVFLMVMAAIGMPALVGVGWAGEVAATADASPAFVAGTGIGITLALAVGTSVATYRRTRRTIAGYTVD